jgi:hypothetical protein
VPSPVSLALFADAVLRNALGFAWRSVEREEGLPCPGASVVRGRASPFPHHAAVGGMFPHVSACGTCPKGYRASSGRAEAEQPRAPPPREGLAPGRPPCSGAAGKEVAANPYGAREAAGFTPRCARVGKGEDPVPPSALSWAGRTTSPGGLMRWLGRCGDTGDAPRSASPRSRRWGPLRFAWRSAERARQGARYERSGQAGRGRARGPCRCRPLRWPGGVAGTGGAGTREARGRGMCHARGGRVERPPGQGEVVADGVGVGVLPSGLAQG